MSELSNKLAALKGKHTTAEIVEKLGISRETFRRIERGDSVKLSTLKEIANVLGVKDEDWIELIIAWIKLEIGQDAQKMWIEPKEQKASKLHDAQESAQAKAMMLFNQLNSEDRHQIILAMERPEIRRSLPALNKLYDSLR